MYQGFTEGFRLHYSGLRIPIVSRNLKSAESNLQLLKEKLLSEVNQGWMIGPFSDPPIPSLRVSPVGMIPKSDGGLRLITHLSFPLNISVNDFIDEDFCTVKYTSFDNVIQMIAGLGPGALLAKRDIKSAFRLLPVYPDDFHLLGIKCGVSYFIDKCLPMGASLSCNLFEKFSSFLHWLVSYKSGIISLDHYLDDFILAGKADTDECLQLISTFDQVCADINVPVAADKSVGPTTNLVFVGLVIDTVNMLVRIPLYKLEELTQYLKMLRVSNKISLLELQALCGKSNFVCRAVYPGRPFIWRFHEATYKLKKLHHRIRVNTELKKDMSTWLTFLKDFHGVVYFPSKVWERSEVLTIYTDSAGSSAHGCGCYLGGSWSFYRWPEHWVNSDILLDLTTLEMIPVMLVFMLWGEQLKNHKTLQRIDNEALVYIINKQTTKNR